MHAKRFISYVFWLLVLGLTGLLFWNSRGYLSDPSSVVFYRDRIADAPKAWRFVLVPHVGAGMLCLLTGPLLFLPLIRNAVLHAILGSVYVFSTLGVMLPTGLWLSLYAHGGVWGRLGFLITGLWMMGATAWGMVALRKHRLQAHRRWMMRSYALALSALTFRLVYICGYTAGLVYTLNYPLSTWLSTLLNICLVEGIIHFHLKPKPQGVLHYEKTHSHRAHRTVPLMLTRG